MSRQAETPNVAKNQHVTDLDNYLTSISRVNQGGIDEDGPPPRFLSKDRLAGPGGGIANTAAERELHSRFADMKEAEGEPRKSSLIGAICLTVLVVGVLYHQLKTPSEASLPAEPAQVAAAITPSSTSFEESMPTIDNKSRLADDLADDKSPLADDMAWTDALAQYKQWVAQQYHAGQDKGKQAENQQLLGRFEVWMNKDAR
jgi:hypothetical protein